MKKLKIMLLSLALFAVVGGALAFKAKYTSSYCTIRADFDGSAWSCPSTPGVPQACALFQTITTTTGSGIRFCTTNVNAGGTCVGKTTCTTLNKFIDNQ